MAKCTIIILFAMKFDSSCLIFLFNHQTKQEDITYLYILIKLAMNEYACAFLS